MKWLVAMPVPMAAVGESGKRQQGRGDCDRLLHNVNSFMQ